MASRSLRLAGRLVRLALALLGVACAGDLTVRAPEPQPLAGGALAAVAPLRIALAPTRGERADEKVVGLRAAGFATTQGPIALTQTPGAVVHSLVAAELRAGGHHIVDAAQGHPEVVIVPWIREFTVDAPRQGSGWDVIVRTRIALIVSARPGAEDHTEFVYTAERTSHSLVRPTLGTTERLLSECLADLGRLVAERGALARALEDHAQRAGAASPSERATPG